MTNQSQQVQTMVAFIKRNRIVNSYPTPSPYNHMGAVLADAILQAGINYETVVKPRVRRIVRDFPQAATTTNLLDLISEIGPARVLAWRHPEKPKRFAEISAFLYVRGIETEQCLRNWLQIGGNQLALQTIQGVGPKTVDYIKILVGMQAIAVDRHLKYFTACAGLPANNYHAVRKLLESAAEKLRVSYVNLDYSIWSHDTAQRSSVPFGRK